jgi:hypothetical protein
MAGRRHGDPREDRSWEAGRASRSSRTRSRVSRSGWRPTTRLLRIQSARRRPAQEALLAANGAGAGPADQTPDRFRKAMKYAAEQPAPAGKTRAIVHVAAITASVRADGSSSEQWSARVTQPTSRCSGTSCRPCTNNSSRDCSLRPARGASRATVTEKPQPSGSEQTRSGCRHSRLPPRQHTPVAQRRRHASSEVPTGTGRHRAWKIHTSDPAAARHCATASPCEAFRPGPP